MYFYRSCCKHLLKRIVVVHPDTQQADEFSRRFRPEIVVDVQDTRSHAFCGVQLFIQPGPPAEMALSPTSWRI